ncbi:LexA family transcriptional regulator [Vreelandella andesensis]|uniref:LexA family transcriptional regulator n=1 Tax=Vreelandella andesensis TaxID=447567 RepID=A0A3S0W6P7_9GAMM|nr:XRE family transcriptional regulator [Halomonas andesensis]RUR29727.1 LexA family transcriptional regulator [Halomonas andesensis]
MTMVPLSTLGKRLKQLMNEHSISDSELSKRSGVPQPSIHRLVHDKTKSPKYDNVSKIARTLGVSADFLMHGIVDDSGAKNTNTQGACTADTATGIASVSLGVASFFPVASVVGGTVISALKALKKPRSVSPPPVYLYPQLSWRETNRLDALNDPEFVSKKNCAYSGYEAAGRGFWLTMKGDAMAAPMGQMPTLPEGIKVLFDTGKRVTSDTLVLVMLPSSNTLTCRLLIEEAGERLLKPLNPAYPMTLVKSDTLILASALEARTAL